MKQFSHVLITGGAGFIGSHLTDALIQIGYKVRIIDNLEEQVHRGKKPSYLNPQAEFILGDVRDREALVKALVGIDAVFHEAAAVGVGQSQYEIKRYIDVNVGGTANLLDILANSKHTVKKILTTASMTAYGEGYYHCESCGTVQPMIRGALEMSHRRWELSCPYCDKKIIPIPTNESALPKSTNIYALTKKMQEDMFLAVGKIYKIPAVIFRCFNVYGTRQSLSNPYTGVTAIFISRIKNNQRPFIYEDGLQTRDFISVRDVVKANILALENDKANYNVFNIGSSKAISIKKVAETLSSLLGKKIKPEINGEYRLNDIRHCFADISLAQKKLHWKPKVSFEEGMRELIHWAEREQAVDATEQATLLLKQKGLIP